MTPSISGRANATPQRAHRLRRRARLAGVCIPVGVNLVLLGIGFAVGRPALGAVLCAALMSVTLLLVNATAGRWQAEARSLSEHSGPA
jgi:hypothetical protein